jgi:membrane-bound metal-dependent hydrolase YbcI (DUF457 family)
MDPLTTGIGGALLAKALPDDYRGPSGVLAVTVASVVSDADILSGFFNNDLMSSFTSHRAFTHSLAGVVVLAPLLALLFRRFSRDKNYRRLLALAALGLLWHIFTDLATSWGTMVFHPFSRDRLAWDLLFIIDFSFTAVLLLPHLVAWTYRDPRRALLRGALLWAILTALAALANSLVSTFLGVAFHWGLFALLSSVLAALFLAPAFKGWGFRQDRAVFCRIGVAALVIYLATCAGSHFLAVQQVKEFVREKNLKVETLAALPQPLSPFRWSGLVLTPKGVYQGWFNVLDSDPPAFRFFPSARNDYVARAQKLPEVQTYLWFARFPVARYRTDGDRHMVEYTDLRFRTRSRRAPPFTFRVTLNGNGDVLTRGFHPAD